MHLFLLFSSRVAFALILSAAAARAEGGTESPISVTLTPAYVSQYMFRGQRLSGQSFQPSVELNTGNIGVGVWANVPLAGKIAGVSDPEIDPYAYYSITLSQDLTLVPGFTAYTFPRANTANGFYRATFEPNLALSWNVQGVRLTPKVFYDLQREGATGELSAAYAFPLKEFGTELDFTAQYGEYLAHEAKNHTTPSTKTWGRYWLAGVMVPFQFSATSRVAIGWAYTEGSNAFFKQDGVPRSRNSLAAGRGVVTVSYSCTF